MIRVRISQGLDKINNIVLSSLGEKKGNAKFFLLTTNRFSFSFYKAPGVKEEEEGGGHE